MSRWFRPTILGLSLVSAFPLLATEQVSPRIINGENATQHEWPYMTALVSKGAAATSGQFCGASLIGEKYVLTAAHCVEGLSTDDFDVIVGINNLNNSSEQGQRVAIERFYIHQDYQDLLNDIALLEIATPVHGVTPSVLAGASTRTNTPDGTVLTVAGWGSTTPEYGNHTQSAQLLQVDAPLVNQTLCSNVFSGVSVNEDSPNFCAGIATEGYDSCRGDSGGPIVNKNTGVQLGLVSFGSRQCGEENTYGVYTNLSYYAEWLEQHTQGLKYQQNEYIGFLGLGSNSHQFSFSNDSESPITFTSASVDKGVITADACVSNSPIQPGESCTVTVDFDITEYSSEVISLAQSYNAGGTNYSITSKAEYLASIPTDTTLADQLGLSGVDVYVNDKGWLPYGNNGIRSGVVGDSEWSFVAFDGVPRGSYRYQVTSSSESYDQLYVIVNGKVAANVGGIQNFQETIYFAGVSNRVTLLYMKDGSISVGDDAIYITEFTKTSDVSASSAARSGSGGSLGWLSLLILTPLLRRKK